MEVINAFWAIRSYLFLCFMRVTKYLAMNEPPHYWPDTISKCILGPLLFSYFIHTYIFCCLCVHYMEVFFDEGTKNRVHCSELGGVHYIEVLLQQKLIGGTGTSVQTRGVH